MSSLKSILLEQSKWTTPPITSCGNAINDICKKLYLDPTLVNKRLKNGKLVYLNQHIKDRLQNTKFPKVSSYAEIVDFIQKKQKSNPEYVRDWKQIQLSLKSQSQMDAPIILKHKNEYYLIDGNIRLMVAKLLDLPLYGYVFAA